MNEQEQIKKMRELLERVNKTWEGLVDATWPDEPMSTSYSNRMNELTDEIEEFLNPTPKEEDEE